MNPFRRRGLLGTTLGLTYVRVTLVAVGGLLILGTAVGTHLMLRSHEQRHQQVAESLAPVAADLLAYGVPGAVLASYVDRPIRPSVDGAPIAALLSLPPTGRTVVVRADGTVWYEASFSGEPGGGEVPALAQEALQTGRELQRRAGFTTATARPLTAADGTVLGALVQTAGFPASPARIRSLVLAALAASAFVVGVGTVFGLHASRPLVRRFQAIGDVAEAWSGGGFHRSIRDGHDDELGRLAGRLDLMAGRIQELLRQGQELARLRERTRLAHDLHDSAKQRIFAASMRLAAARSGPAGEADAHLAAVDGLLRSTHEEFASLIETLRPQADDVTPLWSVVHNAVDPFVRPGQRPEIEVRLNRSLVADPETAMQLGRIVQESLANAIRHGDAARVQVELEAQDGTLTLSIADDGKGFDPRGGSGGGHGLRSIQSRALELGADLRIDTAPAAGTRVQVRMAGAAGADLAGGAS